MQLDEFKVPVSVVIPVKNEEANLPSCLESLAGFDDIIVVDSSSSDATCEIAYRYGCRVINFQWDGKFPKKRNWVLQTQKFKYDWILFLDADECVTQDFVREIKTLLKDTKHCGFWLSYQTWFLGKVLRHGLPSRKLALVKLGYGAYEEIFEDNWSSMDMEIHEHIILDGTSGTVKSKLEHNDKGSLSIYYSRQSQYVNWETKRYLAISDFSHLTFRQKVKYRMILWPGFPILYFLGTYIFMAGFLDGLPGFYSAIYRMSYFYQIQTQIIELLSSPHLSTNQAITRRRRFTHH
ncbi:MAG: hypothetical protein RLZZ511_1197 [Cyanobacteriota bacterium]|jgi:glycosyltransferase involved in cell wall biosynthesis